MLHGRRVALPIRLFARNWPAVWRDVSGRGGSRPELEIIRSKGKPRKLFDAWELREEFLRIRKDTELLAFLNKVGEFHVGVESRRKSHYWEYQRLLSDMLVHTPERWGELRKRYSENAASWANPETRNGLVADLKFRLEDGVPITEIFVVGALRGMVASVHIDHLSKVRFGICQRVDCAKPFLVKSQHGQKWCDPNCGRVESQRRKRQKRAE